MLAPLARSALLLGSRESGGEVVVTLGLAINGSDFVTNGNAGSVIATLSAARLVDTVLSISNGGISQAEITTPQTMLAGSTELEFFVANTGGYDGPVAVSVTTDAGAQVTVLNNVVFTFEA